MKNVSFLGNDWHGQDWCLDDESGWCMVNAMPMLVLAPSLAQILTSRHSVLSGAVDVVTAVTFSHDWGSGSGK